jgi:hypothetical protein
MSLDSTDRQELLVHVARLEELTHELSNWVSLSMNYLVKAGNERSKMYDHVATSTGLSVRATGSLRNLMVELANLHRALAKQGSDRKGNLGAANDAA